LGLLDPLAGDEDSVRYFDAIDEELVGATRADSYSSVKEGDPEKSVNIVADIKILYFANTFSRPFKRLAKFVTITVFRKS
jgi:hypothetical protein